MQTPQHTYPHFTFRPEDLLDRAPIVLDMRNAAREIRGRIVLITGAAGTIGSELASQVCASAPAKVILVDQAETALFELEYRLQQQFPRTDISTEVASITDALRMAGLFSQHNIHVVFHAAAYKHVPLMERHPYEAIKTNILGTEILADLAVSYRVRKFIYISTDKAVRPASVMGATKRFAEMYLQYLSREYPGQTRFIITRFGNVLGSNGSFLIRFAQQIRDGGPVTVTDPLAHRYLMTVTEACQLVLQATAVSDGGEILSFDMGKPVRIADVARKMIRLAGVEAGRDIQILFTGLRPGEKLSEDLEPDGMQTTTVGELRTARFVDTGAQCMRYAMSVLQKALDSGRAEEMVGALKMMIPEYVSANSPYAKLDNLHVGGLL
ncbi:MAG: polysaccharide biosynthesis protein [Dyadobacter sp.]|uniref:polysaccharide biosynthesis protein n=1 Tax=Dyadobacter sp. TaxID=1914288 RepID=UPI001B1F759F|nr:polysaccharide biosynthesis protein [Dyadobacter sp.]MBO9615716.1 polysaccharide biosynthesis protein [Dyadobacter sp.]